MQARQGANSLVQGPTQRKTPKNLKRSRKASFFEKTINKKLIWKRMEKGSHERIKEGLEL